MHDTGIRQLTWTANVEERDRQFSEDNPNISTRVIAQQLGMYQSAVWPIVRERVFREHNSHVCAYDNPHGYEKSRYATSFCRKYVDWNHCWLFVGNLLATALTGLPEIPNHSRDSFTDFTEVYSTPHPSRYVVST
ncbi:hypothetical protein TNCV_4611491 [Trichonephila clavipes]|nr:hypothetical protein TNCV_4611491 [Trichonephila clavipes]